MRLSEIARFTDDVPAMTEFYRQLLGADPVFESPDMASFRCGNVTILIHKTYTPGPGDLPCENHVAFTVPDLEAAYSTLQRQNFTFVALPTAYPWGRSAYLRDPDGNLVELCEDAKSS